MTLLDRLNAAMNSPYLSDLRKPNRWERSCMAHIIAQIAPDDHTLAQWNDALDYLTGAPAQPTAGAAKQRLIALLDRNALPHTDIPTHKKKWLP